MQQAGGQVANASRAVDLISWGQSSAHDFSGSWWLLHSMVAQSCMQLHRLSTGICYMYRTMFATWVPMLPRACKFLVLKLAITNLDSVIKALLQTCP